MKKKPITPASKITYLLKEMFLRSRERQEAVRQQNNTCHICKRKNSRAIDKEVYVIAQHVKPVDWDRIVAMIRELILDAEIICTCKDCLDNKKPADDSAG